jgi:hypothetical protein
VHERLLAPWQFDTKRRHDVVYGQIQLMPLVQPSVDPHHERVQEID